MLEMKDGKKILTTPISAEDLKDIHIGDIVYLNGSMTTCRDVAHRRLVEEGRELPVDVRDAAIELHGRGKRFADSRRRFIQRFQKLRSKK